MEHLLGFKRQLCFPDLEIVNSEDFQELAELAALVCSAPMATVKFRGPDWRLIKARIGLSSYPHSGCDQFSTAVMASRSLLVVEDASQDQRFADHPLVSGGARVRFLAGAAIHDEHGVPVGAICVFDHYPRQDGLDAFQKRALLQLAKAAGAQLVCARTKAILRDSEASFRLMTELMPQMVWGTCADGYHDYFNPRWYEFTGASPEASQGEGWAAFFHPDDRERAWIAWRKSLETACPYEIEYRLRHRSGEYRWVLGRALPLCDADGRPLRWVGTCTDIHDQKLAIDRANTTAERYRYAASATQDGIWDWDLATDEVSWGQSAHVVLGYEEAEIGSNATWWASRLHPEDAENVTSSLQRTLEAGMRWEQEYRFRADDGTYREIHDRGFVIRGATGEPVRMVGAAMDVTVRRAAERALRQSRERLDHALSAAKMIAWERDPAKGITWKSNNGVELLGLPKSAGTDDILDNIHPEDREQLSRALISGDRCECEFRYRKPDGGTAWLLSRGQTSESGTMVGVTFDITERKLAEGRLEHLATHDALTGLPNRVLLHNRFSEAILQAQQTKSSLSLLLIDLDDFKNVNDTLGHDAGDALLKEVAGRLESIVGPPNIVARLGGDEFAILLVEPFTRVQAEAFAPYLIERMKDSFIHHGHPISTRISIGIASYPEQGKSGQELMKNADIALYEAKKRGRNRAVIFSARMRAQIEDRVRLVEDIRRGIEAGEFRAYYQPRVNLATGKVVGLEALARWSHPSRGLLGPASFLPAFEDEELAKELGAAIFDSATADAAEWVRADVPFGKLAINFSTAEFKNPRLADLLLSKWCAAGIPASKLDIEVTESVFLSANVKRVTDSLRRFRAAGATISLDDFGTGYASLTHLKQFPVDHLKIDKSFIAELEDQGDDHAITSAIIGLARSLRLSVTAEGIETQSQADLLRGLGCDFGQGFYFSKPVDGLSITEVARCDFSAILTSKPLLRIV